MPNYGEPGRGPRLAEGMVLAIEPMVNAGKPAVKVLADGWTAVTRDGSLSAHFEHTVAVTADGPWILTARRAGRRRAERACAEARGGSRSRSWARRRAAAERAVSRASSTGERGSVTAHIADRIDRNFVRHAGRRSGAWWSSSPYDVGRGRIVRRQKVEWREDLMKVEHRSRRICDKCKVVRRHGVVRVICSNQKHKQRQG